jgi:hypothetical protein
VKAPVRVRPEVEPLVAALRTLWSGPVRVELTRGGSRAARAARAAAGARGGTEFLVVPSARRPSMLLPADSRLAAASAASRWGSGTGGLKGAARRWALVGVLRLDLAGLLFRDRLLVTDDGPQPDRPAGAGTSSGAGASSGAASSGGGASSDLARFLAERLPDLTDERALLAIRTGSLRANRKPVLQVLHRDGAIAAFVKVGHDPLTHDLVRAEGAALARVQAAGLTGVTVPTPLFRGGWRDLELLALSPLPLSRRQPPAAERLPEQAWLEVAGIAAGRATLRNAPFWARLDRAAGELGPDHRDGVRVLTDRLERRHGSTELRLGAWHGDWTAWNMQARGGRVLLWDWERFADGVPAGFDPLHHRLNDLRLVRGLSMERSVAGLLTEAGGLLRPLGADPRHAELVAHLYLLELAVRYLHDGRTPAGGTVLRHGSTLLADLTRRLG